MPLQGPWAGVTGRAATRAWSFQPKTVKVKYTHLSSSPNPGEASCARNFPKGDMCFQDSHNNGKWYFILWEETSPTFYVSYLPLYIYLLQISACLWSLWMPGICNRKSKADKRLSRRQNSLHPSHWTPKCQKERILAGGKNYNVVNICKGLVELAEQRRSK